MLMIMLALAAPLLGAIGRHSLIVELVGPAAVGKSLAHRLAASVTGDIGELPLPFEDVMTALNRHAADHTGTLMRIDDPGTALAASSLARLASNVRDAVVGLSGTDDVPTAVLIVGRKSLVDLVGPESPVAEVISGRSIVLRIGTERQLGIFDDVPENYASASAFAEALHTACKTAHGAPLIEIVKRLVKHRAVLRGFAARSTSMTT